MRAAGCVVNDLWDRDIDRQVARTAGRPLASGAIRPRHALVFLAVLAGLRAAGAAEFEPAGAGAGGGVAGAGRAVSAGEAGHLVAATDDGFHLRIRRADGLRGRVRADRSVAGLLIMPPRFSGISASIRSTRIRTARMTRWSACAPPPGCSASEPGRFWRCAMRAAVLLVALAGWSAGFGGWFFVGADAARPDCSRCQVVALDIHDPGRCLRAVSRQPRGRAGIRAGDPGRRGPGRVRRDGHRIPVAFHSRQHAFRRGASGARDRAVSGHRDHPDLAGDRGLAARTSAGSLRSGLSPGPAVRLSRDTCWTILAWSRASACWISPPAEGSPPSPAPAPAPRWWRPLRSTIWRGRRSG